ncbi:MAG: hypothetical protein INH34_18490 [Phycisphaerales bacterium]|nr:hypothetical protein [Phycisphaerales bacterium]
MSMPAPQPMSGEAFAVERLRENPDLDYAELRRLANEAGISIQPIQYGRARKQLALPALAKTARPAAPAAAKAPAAAARTDNDDGMADGGDVDADTDATDARAQDAGSAPAAAAGAPRRRGSDAFDFLVSELRRDSTLVYGELRAACEQRGWKIAPIMYGRAKAVLGLVPVKPRGSGKAATATAAAASAAASAPARAALPRTLKQVESVAADRFQQQLDDVRNVEQLVAIVKQIDAERRRLRELLEDIAARIDEALG